MAYNKVFFMISGLKHFEDSVTSVNLRATHYSVYKRDMGLYLAVSGGLELGRLAACVMIFLFFVAPR